MRSRPDRVISSEGPAQMTLSSRIADDAVDPLAAIERGFRCPWSFSVTHTLTAFLSRRITEDLQDHGIEAWLDQQSLNAGYSWPAQISRVIESSDAVLVILTRDSIRSEWVTREWGYALSHSKRVIPVLATRLKQQEIPLGLQGLDFIDLTTDYQAAITRIKAIIRGSTDPRPAEVVDKDQVVREVIDRVTELLGIEQEPSASHSHS